MKIIQSVKFTEPTKVIIGITDKCKYMPTAKKRFELQQTITGFEVRHMEPEETHTSEDSIDEYNEYLVLIYTDGEESTFRNSHTDLFKI